MIYAHKRYTCFTIPNSDGVHLHTPLDMLRLTAESSMSLDGEVIEPSVLESGVWRVACTVECERRIRDTQQYTGLTESSIPLTKEEEAEADAEAKRSNVQVATMARALHRVIANSPDLQ